MKARSVAEIARETGVPIESFHPVGGGLHMEIIDTSTTQVWQTMDDISVADAEALKVEAPYRAVGIGNGKASLAGHTSYFTRSPDAESDGPMETLELARHLWSNCARPIGAPGRPAGEAGPMRMSVQKHHTIVYELGRELQYLRTPDGEYFVHVIEGGVNKAPLVVPEGWQLSVHRVEKELILPLPCPTTVFFFRNVDSFQGPVPEPSS